MNSPTLSASLPNTYKEEIFPTSSPSIKTQKNPLVRNSYGRLPSIHSKDFKVFTSSKSFIEISSLPISS